jgi:hypothetical protein
MRAYLNDSVSQPFSTEVTKEAFSGILRWVLGRFSQKTVVN